ncbi:AraC family transcriptional regulator [Actinoplanes sp. NBRC 103695]|uniref:AraC family transcriptional regulator n=1 Tax=Actinoplanes sp. NBRC 103695 TaxID=3032202 RepID=UPI0025562BDE|nr:AraC family transcriptional regulator [Actinoplanes sp. NBRC 103695]
MLSVRGFYCYPEFILDRGYTFSIMWGGAPPPMRYRGLDHPPAAPETITVAEPDEVIQPLSAGPTTAHFTTFTVLDPQPLLDATWGGELPQFDRLTYADPELCTGFAALHLGLTKGVDHKTLRSKFAALLQKLVRRHATPPGAATEPHRPPALRTVRQILRERMDSNIGLDELAAVAGCSRHHLVRSFRQAYGVPPHRYRTLLRLASARALLAQGLPAAEVAARSGYFDQSQLNRHFREAFGVSAGAYARAVQ